jgi:hypothetical protein
MVMVEEEEKEEEAAAAEEGAEDVNEEEQEEQEEEEESEREREIPRSRVSAAKIPRSRVSAAKIPRSRVSAAHQDCREIGRREGEGLGSCVAGEDVSQDVAKATATLAALYRRPLPLPWLSLSDLPTHPLAAASAAAAARGGFIQRKSCRGGDGSGCAVTPHKVRRWLCAAREEALRDGGGDCGEPGLGQETARGKQGLAPQGAKGGRRQGGEDVDGGVWEEAAAAGGGRGLVLPSCAVAENLKAVLDVLREGGGGGEWDRGEDCVWGGEGGGLSVRLAFICQALPPSRPGGGGRCGDISGGFVQSGVGVLAP